MANSVFRNKNLVRPVKRGKAKRQRLAQQSKRLLALGVSEEQLRKLTVKDIRTMLKNPTKVAGLAKYLTV